MPYALVELVETSTPTLKARRGFSRNFVRQPAGYDRSAHNVVRLRGATRAEDRALVWFDDEVVDSRVLKLADGAGEKVAEATKQRLDAFAGDREFRTIDEFNASVAGLLTTPTTRGRWGALKPSFRRQRREIWLGPGGAGRNLFWSEAALVRRGSVQYQDTFNRTAANLNGSTLSSGTVQWAEVGGTTFTGANNRAEATNLTSGADCFLVVNTDTDTDDMYAEAAWKVWTRNGATSLISGVFVRAASDISSGYEGYIEDDGGDGYALIYAWDFDDVIASGAEPTLPFVQKIGIEADGSTIEMWIDDVSWNGPLTDTNEPTGAGLRRGAIQAVGNGANTNDIALDDFLVKDVSFVAATGFGALLSSTRNRLVIP